MAEVGACSIPGIPEEIRSGLNREMEDQKLTDIQPEILKGLTGPGSIGELIGYKDLRTVRKHIQNLGLPATRLNGRYRALKSAVLKWMIVIGELQELQK